MHICHPKKDMFYICFFFSINFNFCIGYTQKINFYLEVRQSKSLGMVGLNKLYLIKIIKKICKTDYFEEFDIQGKIIYIEFKGKCEENKI